MSTNSISLIVAAYNVENFIVETLESITNQTKPFHEVIVVEDASTDRTLQLLNEYCAHQMNIVLLPQEKNVGLGQVRNIGLSYATGNYIAFLDGDDTLTENAHSVMLDALQGNPDVAIFNHGRLYSDGVLVPNKLTALLEPDSHETEKQRISLFRNLNVAWNKVYKKDFLLKEKMSFPTGKYEDIRWNFESIIKAKRISANPEVIIKYRQRPGSILRSKSNSHFDIFDRWSEVWRMFEERPDLPDAYREQLRLIQFRSFQTVLTNPCRVPTSQKLNFSRKMTDLCAPMSDEDIRKLGRTVKLLNLPFGAALFAAVKSQPALSFRQKYFTVIRKCRQNLRSLKKRLHLMLYKRFMIYLPIDQSMIVYQSYWGKKIACNPYAIFAHLDARAPGKYRHVWVTRSGVDTRATQDSAVHVREGTLKFYYYCARAGYMINNANFPTEVVKKKGSIHVQTKHGTPLKYMGLDIVKKDPKGLGNVKSFAQRCMRWDYVISSNSYSSQVWRKAFPYNYEVIESGYPRNDRLASKNETEIAMIRQRIGVPEGKRVVLYAPTFRPKDRSKSILSKSSAIVEKRNIVDAIMSGLHEDEILAIRDHYFLPANSHWENDPRVIDLSGYDSTTDVLLASDVLITDYSSIMFDYAKLDRPIYTLAHDLEHYEEVRGTYFNLRDNYPCVFCESPEELTDALQRRAAQNDSAQERFADFRRIYCSWDDGEATRRVCEKVFGKYC